MPGGGGRGGGERDCISNSPKTLSCCRDIETQITGKLVSVFTDDIKIPELLVQYFLFAFAMTLHCQVQA